jgi:acyl carrier protein
VTRGEIQSTITDIVTNFLMLEVPSPDADLIAAGQLDSLSLIELMVQLEQRLGVSVSLDDVEVEDLRSVTSLAALVAERLQAA